MKNVQAKLSVLWIARVLTGVQGDILRFLSPGFIQESIDGTTDIEITNELILILGIILSFPIILSVLSMSLEGKLNRRINLGFGIFFTLFDLVFLIMIIASGDEAFEIYYGFLYLLFTASVAWTSWNWNIEE